MTLTGMTPAPMPDTAFVVFSPSRLMSDPSTAYWGGEIGWADSDHAYVFGATEQIDLSVIAPDARPMLLKEVLSGIYSEASATDGCRSTT